MNEMRKDVAVNVVDLSRGWTIGYSLDLGASILREMKQVNRLHKTKVEQAGFAVLKGQGIPSVLVETAFISNPQEESLLITHSHQQKIAEAIYRGIRNQMLADTSWKH
ncbi:N-acetylmuramoyl-l-alanine amidase I [gut metagenome]|uniref:N-acetylmuramoyl-l-alanine amidase I n=1 Tax=gut metagenome TaxID=749906 RepID=J9FP87_9ZZZZ